MKRTAPSFILLVLVLALSTSCTSFSDLVRAQVEGLPSWTYDPQARSGELAFVGKGTSEVEYNARLVAYEGIIRQISAYVGEDVRETYYRELTTTDAIEDFELSITSEYARTLQKGDYEVYLLARLNEELLRGKRTSIYNEMLARDQSIASLIEDADSAYRANDDTQAIRLYLNACLLASEGPVDEKKHELPQLVEKTKTFLEALRFSLRSSDASKAMATVYVRRKSRLLSPKVLNAKVNASFLARNSLGEEYTDFLQFNTARDGFFTFIPYNQGLVKEGVVAFSLDFSDLRTALEASLKEPHRSTLLSALDSCRMEMPYHLASPLEGRLTVAEIQEFSQNGSRLEQSTALDSFASELQLDGISLSRVDLSEVEVQEQLKLLEQTQPDASLAFLGSVGVAVVDTVQQHVVVVVSGRVQLLDIASQAVLHDSQAVEAVAVGATLEEARDKAFQRFGSIAAYLQRAWLFTQ